MLYYVNYDRFLHKNVERCIDTNFWLIKLFLNKNTDYILNVINITFKW